MSTTMNSLLEKLSVEIAAAKKYTIAAYRLMTEAEIEKLYRQSKDEYYNEDKKKTTLTDKQFDDLEDVLREKNPRNKALKIIGPATAPKGVVKVKLPAFMGSLSKIKADGTAERFILNSEPPYTISDKLDGNSVLIVNEGTRRAGVPAGQEFETYRMYSRGKGSTGFDISVLLPHIKGVGKLAKGEIVRGELVMLNSAFKDHSAEYENPRNLVGGVVNRAAKSRAVHKAASSTVFYAHGMIKPALGLAEGAPKLKAKGFTVAPYVTVKDVTGDIESKLAVFLKKRKVQTKFDMDGIVITDSRGVSMAFKGEDEEATAEVDRVVWNPSRYGMLNPIVEFKTSVRLAGVNVSRATAHNAKMVNDMGIGPGAKIQIVRSGEVIPKIIGILVKAKPQFPPEGTWEWNATKVDILAKRGTSVEVDEYVKVQRLSSFVGAMGVDGVKAGLATKLVAAGIDNPLRLVKATQAQLVAAGLGPVQASNLHRDLEKALQRVTHLDMMYGSGLFARGWGRERFYLVLSEKSYEDLLALAKRSTKVFYESMMHTKGMEARLLAQLQDGLKRYDQWIARMGWMPKIDVEIEEEIDGPLSGYNVVFTKVRSADAEQKILDLGGKISGAVNAQTRWVVAPEGEDSAKIRAAIAKGIDPITLEQLLKELKKPMKVSRP